MEQKTYEPLDSLIERKGLKYKFVADELGISQQRLYGMRLNPKSISVEQMEKMANVLSVSFMDIYKIQKKFREEVDKNATNKPQPS
ncbi:helix-turn-helix domain-containing protein [Facklamia sp. P9177]|uniref:helix-turn-helix domain-containing protein n=1 Tax=Facklamia sp. P9177 TaxID=3421945 RepID=UPI003D177F64